MAASAALLVAVGELAVSLPSFGSLSGLSVPVALLTPAVVLLVLSYGLANGDAHLEAVAARRIWLLDNLLVVSTVTSTAALGLLAHAMGLSPLGTATARNAIGLAGLMLLGRHMSPRAGALLPVIFLVIVTAVGSNRDGTAEWWAWPAALADEASSWAIAGGLAFGSLLFTSRVRPSLDFSHSSPNG
ncbi:MAG: hypothetical protein ABI744_04205 [Chloroflexota bacterium]